MLTACTLDRMEFRKPDKKLKVLKVGSCPLNETVILSSLTYEKVNFPETGRDYHASYCRFNSLQNFYNFWGYETYGFAKVLIFYDIRKMGQFVWEIQEGQLTTTKHEYVTNCNSSCLTVLKL